jgi:hypothetical protein
MFEAMATRLAVDGLDVTAIAKDPSMTGASIAGLLMVPSENPHQRAAPGFEEHAIIAALAVHENAPVIEATPALLEMLDHTDIEHEIAADQLRMPMPRSFYLLMPRLDLQVYDGSGGYYPFEGVLVRESEPIDPITGDRERWLELVLTSAITESSKNALDDATYYRPIAIGPTDAGKSLLELIKDYDAKLYDTLGVRLPEANSPEAQNNLIVARAVALVSKVLLYLNLPEARRIEQKDRSNLVLATPPLNPVKRRKYEQRLRGVYDRIVVGPTWTEAGLTGDGGGASRRAHFRRGHFRNQAHGPGLTLRRIVWIRPAVIGTVPQGESVQTRDYMLKGGS